MIAAVGGYTLLGAYIMQRLESGVENARREELRSMDKKTVDREVRELLIEPPKVCELLGEPPKVCELLGEPPKVCELLGELPKVCELLSLLDPSPSPTSPTQKTLHQQVK